MNRSAEATTYLGEVFSIRMLKHIEYIENTISAKKTISYNDIFELPVLHDMEEDIKTRFGLNITINPCALNGELASIMVAPMNRNHVLLWPYIRGKYMGGDVEKLVSSIIANDERGSVDMIKMKLGGFFSKYKHNAYIDIISMVKNIKLTTKEIYSLILREIKRAIDYYVYADRIDTVNQRLAELIRDKAELTPNIRKFKLRDIATNLNQPEDYFDSVADAPLGNIFSNKLFAALFVNVKSLYGPGDYEETSGDQLASDLSTRFGYGAELVSALDKLYIYRGFPEKSKRRRYNIYFGQLVFKLLGLIALFGVFSVVTPIAVLVLYILAINSGFVGGRGYPGNGDQVRVQYARIREAIIKDFVMERHISKEDASNILAQLDYIEMIMDNTELDFWYTFTDKFTNIVSSTQGNKRQAYVVQRLLEELAANEMWKSYLKLVQISD